jgi:hypothetical protein
MNSEINTTEIHDIMFPCDDILHGDDEFPSDRELFTHNSKDMPPAPPDEDDDEDEDEEINLIIYPYNPDFSFIAKNDTRDMISSAYNCVMNKEDAWQNIKNFRGESYMFSKDKKINQLMNDIDSMYEGGHSGASIGWTMRQIERIAYIGFDKFKSEWIMINK